MMVRFDPFVEVENLMRPFGSVVRSAGMPLDAYRSGDEYVVDLDLPGVERSTIDLTVERNVLSVRATRQRPEREGVEAVISERPMGVFSRELFLGDNLDTDKLEAGNDNGVLTLRIPVSDRAKPRKISIGSGNGRKHITS